MTLVLILNIMLSALVVFGIVGHLGHAIVRDRRSRRRALILRRA
jgi:hypothetical protein